jgi:hypothetical protein
MTRLLRTLVFVVAAGVLLGLAGTASAQELCLNRDRDPIPQRFATAGDLHQTRIWLERAGLSAHPGSFMDSVFHFAVGIGYPMSPSTNFHIGGGTGFRFGVSF